MKFSEDLANSFGFMKNTVYAWEKERSQPNFETLIKLAEFFQVSVGYLVGAEDEFGHAVSKDIPQRDKDLLKAFHKLGPFEQETVLIQINALAEKMVNDK